MSHSDVADSHVTTAGLIENICYSIGVRDNINIPSKEAIEMSKIMSKLKMSQKRIEPLAITSHLKKDHTKSDSGNSFQYATYMEDIIGPTYMNNTILRGESEKYSHFYAFENNQHAINYILSLPAKDRVFHEVIFGNIPQRVKADIDIKYSEYLEIDDSVLARYTQYNEKYNKLARYYAERMLEAMSIICSTSKQCEGIEFSFENDIIITESHGLPEKYPDPEQQKISFHIILRNYVLSNNSDIHRVMEKMKELTHPSMKKFIDTTEKKTQNLRMIHCHKQGSTRTKYISNAFGIYAQNKDVCIQHVETDYAISLQSADKTELEYTGGDIPKDLIDSINQLVLAKVKGIDAFRFRCVSHGMLYYDRDYASLCNICHVVHDRDNTMMISYNQFNGEIREHCRRSKGTTILIEKIENKTAGGIKAVIMKNIISKCSENHADIEITNYMIDRENRPRIECFRSRDEPEMVEISTMMDKEVIYIRAPMKIGKTKALIKYLQLLPTASVCIISFRVTFTNTMKANFPDFVTYKEIKGNITPESNKKVIVQVESLHRLQEGYDIIVLDESESIFSQFNSGNSVQEAIAFASFEYQLKNAGQIIAMDAELGERTVELIRMFRDSTAGEALDYNRYQNCKDYTYSITVDPNVYYNELKACIEQNKNVVIVSNNLSHINTTTQYLYQTFGRGIHLIAYTSKTDARLKKEHMSDINKYCKDYQVLLYSPTITAGISIEISHFDRLFAYFTNCSCDAISSIQMMGRIRNVRDKKICICFETQAYYLPETIEKIEEFIERGATTVIKNAHINMEKISATEYKIKRDKRFLLWVYNECVNNRSKKYYADIIISYILRVGAKVELLDKPAVEDLMLDVKDAKLVAEILYSKQVSIANDITYVEYTELVERSKCHMLTSNEQLSLEKYNLKWYYGVEWIHDTFYMEYGNLEQKIVYKNLNMLMAHRNISDFLTNSNTTENKIIKYDDKWYASIYKNTAYCKHLYTLKLLETLGLTHIIDTDTEVEYETIINSMRCDHIREELLPMFACKPPSILESKIKETTLAIVKIYNKILRQMYGYKLKKTPKSETYKLCQIHTFEYKWNADIRPSSNYTPSSHRALSCGHKIPSDPTYEDDGSSPSSLLPAIRKSETSCSEHAPFAASMDDSPCPEILDLEHTSSGAENIIDVTTGLILRSNPEDSVDLYDEKSVPVISCCSTVEELLYS